ncbi:SusC/RagA family TonB-linked outer membrane protein [Galbibacter sp. EGI 63066]|uniref:SusC/RagA family TonB-linked outer membrane protein n=1 Tax=Galbibacter sp. EGI 63066 TaxID=2993559 RepID=UPI002249673B|nr:SusC/RagA family TonB-linked outer membrane protein [Galbibacter sp. EGI 63066]MCX2680644.1 SusC/RagA family TonB-linked outer membrane protein [Galbibacter sp. EGI 63066]
MKNTQTIRYRSLIFLLLLLYGFTVIAQTKANTTIPNDEDQHRIEGVVTDSQGVPIEGVHVLIKNSRSGTFTNRDGAYIISAHPSDVLTFSYIGFQVEERRVGEKSIIDVQLKEAVTDLGAVTVNAGYYTVSEKERTGSIAKISSKDIETQPVTEVLATMQGRIPGVLITQNSGVPGGSFQIHIRGQNSLRSEGNDPLYIIDGVPYSSESIGSAYTNNSAIPGLRTPLNNIDPNSIASIEVLKDADATAIYGSRGANGVILITTKKGKPQFNLNYSYGTGRVNSYFDLMNTEEYLQMRREAYANDGVTEYPANAYDINGIWDQNRYTDWQEVFTGGTSEFMDINGSISGGGEQTQFRLSGNYHRETTVFPGDNSYNKLGVHSSISHKSKDERFRYNLSTGFTIQDNDLFGGSFMPLIDQLAPNAPALYNDDGSLNWENSTWTNPLSTLEDIYSSDSKNLISNLLISYKILPGMELKTSMGYTDTRFLEHSISPSTRYNPAWGFTSEFTLIRKNRTVLNSWIIEPQLSYAKEFGKFKTSLLVGGTFQKQASSRLVMIGSGFSSNSLMENIAAASYQEVITDDKTVYKYNAVFGRLNLSYKNRYIINITGRRDGSSRFGPGKQFANFGAIGGAWVFSEEPWIKEYLGILSFGKFRGSYGVTGNDQIGDYQYLDTYVVNGNRYDGIPVMAPSRLFNPNFSWEENKKLEFALEAGFFKDRLFFTAAYYKNRSSNQLVGIPLPGTTGFSSIQANLNATVENKGWEFSLHSENLRGNDFFWSTSFNISLNRNKLVAFPGLEESTYANSYVIGEPLNIFKKYNYLGLDPESGLYQFTDYNEDGILSRQDDREAIHDFTPRYFGGFQNNIRYKGFTLDFLFQFVKQDNYKGVYSTGLPGGMSNQLRSVQDRWQQPGGNATYQPYTTGLNTEVYQRFVNYYQSNAMIGDASYIRLKNIALSYTLPKEVLRSIKCSFLLKGQNLLTITGYDGYDPESIYTNSLPPLQVLTTGVQLNF